MYRNSVAVFSCIPSDNDECLFFIPSVFSTTRISAGKVLHACSLTRFRKVYRKLVNACGVDFMTDYASSRISQFSKHSL